MVTEKGAAVNKPLTMGAVAQITDQNLYVATKAFPIVMSESIKGTYKYYNKEDLNKFSVELKKPGSSYKRILADVEEQSFLCKNYGLRYDIAEENKSELGGNPHATGAAILADQGLQCLELNMVDTFLATGLYDTADITPTAKWDVATTNPIADIRAAKVTVKNAGRRIPNAILCNEDVYEALLQNDYILDKISTSGIGGTGLRLLTKEEQLAQIFDVQYFNVIKAPGVTDTEKLLLYYIDPVMPAEKPNTGLIIVRNYAGDVVGANGMGITAPQMDDDDNEFIKLKLRFDMVTPATSLGVLFVNTLT